MALDVHISLNVLSNFPGITIFQSSEVAYVLQRKRFHQQSFWPFELPDVRVHGGRATISCRSSSPFLRPIFRHHGQILSTSVIAKQEAAQMKMLKTCSSFARVYSKALLLLVGDGKHIRLVRGEWHERTFLMRRQLFPMRDLYHVWPYVSLLGWWTMKPNSFNRVPHFSPPHPRTPLPVASLSHCIKASYFVLSLCASWLKHESITPSSLVFEWRVLFHTTLHAWPFGYT